MDYKKVDRIADRIKNPTKTPFEKAMSKIKGERRDAMKTPMKKLSDKEKAERLMANKMKSGGLKGGQKKLDKNNNNRIDAQDFKILKAEKAKGRGMGLQDEKVKLGKVMKASKGGGADMSKNKKSKSGSSVKDIFKSYGKYDGKPIELSKGGGADTGTRGEIRSKLSVVADRFKRRMSQMPGKLTDEERKKINELLKDVKPARPGRPMPNIKSDGPKRPMPSRPKPSLGPMARRMGGGMMKKYSKGGGADMGTKMSDKRKRKFKEILERLKSPTTINIKSEYKPGTRSPMQRDRKREGYRAKVESKGGKVLFMDEMKKGGSVMARGCKLGRKKATKLY